MLFLYRPRETWMPFSLPRNQTQQGDYNRRLQAEFESTRRVAAPIPAPAAPDPVDALERLDALHRSGALSDAEFAAAKEKWLRR